MDCNKYLAQHYLYGLIPYQRGYGSGQLQCKEIQVLHTNLTHLFFFIYKFYFSTLANMFSLTNIYTRHIIHVILDLLGCWVAPLLWVFFA